MNIYSILSTKPHNPHYLNRYITFINNCQLKNLNISGYIENHHICPKAKDMFPQYNSFKEYPWNKVKLTARQHYIAHLLLWKTYNNRSMTMAVYYITKTKYHKMNSRLYESLKIERSKHIKKYFSKINIGLVNVKTNNGIKKIKIDEFKSGNFKSQHADTVMVTDGNKSFRVSKNDSRYISGQLVGHTKGMTHAINSCGEKEYVSKDDPRFKTGELKGNNADTITITNGILNRRINPNDDIPSGWYKGMNKKSYKGSIWVTNGVESKMIYGQIPDGWRKGRSFSH